MATLDIQKSGKPPCSLNLIEGFSHFPNFLEPEEVQALQASVDAGPHDETLSTGRPLAATPGVHWHGFPRTHRSWQNGAQIASAPDVPRTCFSALHRLRSLGVIPAGYAFDQAIVNFYPEGCEGIRMHVDRANFDDIIVGFSLGAAVVMDLEPLDARERDEAADPTSETHAKHVLLEEGSVYIFSGHVRWKWKHGIKQGPHRYGDKELPLGERTSITFRRLRRPDQTESDELWITQETKLLTCGYKRLSKPGKTHFETNTRKDMKKQFDKHCSAISRKDFQNQVCGARN